MLNRQEHTITIARDERFYGFARNVSVEVQLPETATPVEKIVFSASPNGFPVNQDANRPWQAFDTEGKRVPPQAVPFDLQPAGRLAKAARNVPKQS